MSTLRAIVVAAVLSIFGAHTAAHAISFTFTGVCSVDCLGNATATLTLLNYTQGNPLVTANFVSFDYSSDFLGSVHVDPINNLVTQLQGNIPTNLPSSSVNLFLSWDNRFFFQTNTADNGWELVNT